MAYETEQVSETNVDTPDSVFPVNIDSFEKKSDLTITTMALANQYDEYFRAGSYSMCLKLLEDNPEFAKSQFTAKDYNQLIDAITTMEKYLKDQVTSMIESTAQAAAGINDNPTEEEASLVTYSAEKINKMHNLRQITLLQSDWSDTYPYTQTITVDGVLSTDDIKVIGVYHPDGNTYEQDKALDKAASLLMYVGDGVVDGAITFKAKKLPVVDFTIIVEGG